jgi:hypothetical protein
MIISPAGRGPINNELARPIGIINYRPILSSEKEPHIKENSNRVMINKKKPNGLSSRMGATHQDRLAD